MLKPSDNSPEQPYRPPFLKQLLHSHPFVFCGGLWVVLVFVGGVASIGLFSAGPMEPEASKPTPTQETIQQPKAQPKVQPKAQQEHVPLSLFGSVVLGCAAGSLLVTQVLRYTTQQRQPVKRLKPSATARKKRRRPSKGRRSTPRKPQQMVSEPTFQAQDHRQPTNDNPHTQVTVLSPEESHPLDWGDENLAEMMDLRKRQSLASLIRTK
jgi:hypothetical protein